MSVMVRRLQTSQGPFQLGTVRQLEVLPSHVIRVTRRVSFGVNIVFRCRSSQKNPKDLKDQRWTGVELIPSGELSFKTETQTKFYRLKDSSRRN